MQTQPLNEVLKVRLGREPTHAEIIAEGVRLINDALSGKPDLLGALSGLVEIIEKAGLINLADGVQLGSTAWFVKASERLDYAKRVLAEAT